MYNILYICFVIETKNTMAKNTKKRHTYNTAVIKVLSEEFNVSEQFVRQCIRKEKHSITAQKIEKHYRIMANASLQKIKEFKSK